MNNSPSQQVFALERPHSSLWTYYLLRSLLFGPLVFFAAIPLYFRYHTLRFRFDEQGIAMRWGILFRREINLTYARIQDIHLTSNLVERWLGLAKIQIQTASGSAKAEMTIEGLKEYELVRDFLYSKMRGVKEGTVERPRPALESAAPAAEAGEADGDLAAALYEVAAELKALRAAIERQGEGGRA
ncbi:MAG TPA: PH domain-containing protein [Thermoanaerobaculia bacterium]|nr:PH domain-containing protein [Thermoanaerobaculia bacterium]